MFFLFRRFFSLLPSITDLTKLSAAFQASSLSNISWINADSERFAPRTATRFALYSQAGQSAKVWWAVSPGLATKVAGLWRLPLSHLTQITAKAAVSRQNLCKVERECSARAFNLGPEHGSYSRQMVHTYYWRLEPLYPQPNITLR